MKHVLPPRSTAVLSSVKRQFGSMAALLHPRLVNQSPGRESIHQALDLPTRQYVMEVPWRPFAVSPEGKRAS